jgi:hypothetical protein
VKASGGSGMERASPRATRRAVHAATAASRTSSTGRTARDSEIAGECDPGMGEQVTALLGTRPGCLTQGQRCAGQLSKADLRMNLDDAVASFADPALNLEQFGLEAESLDRDPLARELPIDGHR